MNKVFWQEKWDNNQIGFHERVANPALVKYVSELNLSEGSRVFLPLCGKTLDIAWLLSQGYQVVGVELVEAAIVQLFDELNCVPRVEQKEGLKHYQTDDLDIYVGDVFALSKAEIGQVDAVYDRAALVSLPNDSPDHMRLRYLSHIIEITDSAPQLLLTFEYDVSLMQGPPFSISKADVQSYYAANYDIKLLATGSFNGKLKADCVAEMVWLLQ